MKERVNDHLVTFFKVFRIVALILTFVFQVANSTFEILATLAIAHN
jgi:hypothetical protein